VLASDGLAHSLRGLTVREASEKLSQLSLPLRTVRIELWPDWAVRAYRVDIKGTQ
jgi:hypothetical protein